MESGRSGGFHIGDDVKVFDVMRVDVRNGVYHFVDVLNWVPC